MLLDSPLVLEAALTALLMHSVTRISAIRGRNETAIAPGSKPSFASDRLCVLCARGFTVYVRWLDLAIKGT